MRSCQHCGAELADGARFCMRCGTPAPVSDQCRSCAEKLPAEALFCPSCGTPRDPETRAPATPASTPSPGSQPVAERRVTSVLFGDLVGFTTLSESLDSEDVRELLSEYFQRCRVIVSRYGGTIEKFIGDAVMAVWGVPSAHEDDAERAVRAGLELVSMVEALGDARGVHGLAQRVGIVTGEVAVTVGATAEGMVAGDAVNTASRVQSVASPGRVWVDDATRELVLASITFDDVGTHVLKGKAEPVRLWQAGVVVAEVGGAHRVDGLEAPFTGRDRDLRLVKELFHASWELARPRLVVVDGEPGVGKSRLAWEFEKYVDGLAATTRWHRGRCLSYGEGVAFWALAEAMRARFGLLETDAGEIVTQRLDEGLERYVSDPVERDWLRPRLAVLLAVEGTGSFAREDLFAAWTAFFEHLAASGAAVVLVVDDAHHADDGLLDFLDHMLATAHAPVFVLALARPELLRRRPDIGGRRATIVRLEPLDTEDMAALVSGLVADLPGASRAQLVERAEGVPLFAVETVRALIDRDLVVPRDGRYVVADGATLDLDAIGAPATLQALVAARLDLLTPDERRVVADAAVLGLTFGRDDLLALGTASRDLDVVLTALCRREILTLTTDRFTAERGQYRFVQSVVRQVAYATQSKRDRKARHLAAADHLAPQAESVDDVAVVVAQHLLDALEATSPGDTDGPALSARACHYLELAADRASAVGAPAQALRLYVSALDHSVEEAAKARLLLSAAIAAIDAGDFASAAPLAERAAISYDGLGDAVRAGRATAEQARALSHLGDNAGAIEVAVPRWQALHGVPASEPALLALAESLSRAANRRGDREARERFTRELLLLAETLGDADALATAYIEMGIAYASVGAPTTARVMYETAVRTARDHGVPAALARALATLAGMLNARDLETALACSQEAVDVARRAGLRQRLQLATANHVVGSWTAGCDLDQVRSLLQEARENAVTDDILTAYGAVALWVADAAGEEFVEIEPLSTATDEEQILSWRSNIRIVTALGSGDTTTAAHVAETAIREILADMGLEDDFLVLWPWLVQATLAAGDVDAAARLLEPVTTAGRGRIAPGVAAMFHRLNGLVAAARGEDPQLVEAELLAGVEALDAFGARGYRARTQEELARWLVGQVRAAEAWPLVDAARSTYASMGATGWLARLDAWSSEHGVPAMTVEVPRS